MMLCIILSLNSCGLNHSGPYLLVPDVPETKPELSVPVLAPAPETKPYVHKVSWPNESLYLISKWYTGHGNNWNVLAKENPTLDPNHIAVGDLVSIPEVLLTSRTPMPQSFVLGSVRIKKTTPSVSPNTPRPIEPPTLFGPIDSDPKSDEQVDEELFPPIE